MENRKFSEPGTMRELGPLLRTRYGRPVRKLGLRIGTTCPHRHSNQSHGCIFCGEGPPRAAPPLARQIESGLARLDPEVGVIAYLQDHTATLMPSAVLEKNLTEIRGCSRVVGIAVGTRPDCLPPDTVDVLARTAREVDLLVELGLQTASPATLRLINRGHTVKCFVDAVRRLHQRSLRVCAHVILGLPTVSTRGIAREGPAEAVATARLIARLGIAAVKLHNCHVLQGTPLADLFRCGLYHPPDLGQYVQLLAAFLEHLPAHVEIHRLVGEARPPALLAPAFTGRKAQSLQHIRAALARRGTYQGMRASDAERLRDG